MVGILLRDFPTRPPAKYADSNMIKVVLEFGALTSFGMTGTINEDVAALDITRPTADSRRFTFVNSSAEIEIVSRVAAVSQITAFVYDPPIT